MSDNTAKTSRREASSAAPVFGDDELGQVRGLLFGDHARQTLERIDTLESAVLGVIEDLKADVMQRMNAIDSRIAAEVENRTTSTAKLSGRLDDEAKSRAKAQAGIRKDLDKSAAAASQQLSAARAVLVDQIETIESDLRDRTVDRETLASFFNATAASLVTNEA